MREVGRGGELRLGDGTRLNRYDLYELCVQSPRMEASFVLGVHGGDARMLGDDFAGAAGIARAWIGLDETFEAVAADVDDEPLRHGVRRLTEEDSGAVSRLTVRERDVLEIGDRVDAVAALNFACCEMHERSRLVTYLRHVLMRLNTGGVLVCDLYAGPDAMCAGEYVQEIDTVHGEIVYRWRQVAADATTARVRNAIDFEAVGPEGELQRMVGAFAYDWRLWGVAELREAMREAGFGVTEVYSSYGDAVDGDGRVVVGEPVSSDGVGAEVDEEGMPGGDEAAVFLVVGRA